MDEREPLVELKQINFSYTTGRPVLRDLDFKLRRGQRVGLIGYNGSGKTTLLHILMGLIRPSSGTVSIFGKSLSTEKDFMEARQRIGFVFQNADDQLFSPTVLEDVAFGLLNQGRSPGEARKMALDTLEQLNLKGFEERLTHKLSGGEKKLVAFATVLVCRPELLLLDEPTTGLDFETCGRIIEILNELPITYLMVSHEYDFLAKTTHEIYSIHNGGIVFNGDSQTLHSHFHAHPTGGAVHHHD
jgi:cobalt/nickel transport system ATP-binding protein